MDNYNASRPPVCGSMWVSNVLMFLRKYAASGVVAALHHKGDHRSLVGSTFNAHTKVEFRGSSQILMMNSVIGGDSRHVGVTYELPPGVIKQMEDTGTVSKVKFT